MTIENSWSLSTRQAFDLSDTQWYPPAQIERSYPDVPERISEAAAEAYRCMSVRASSAAVGMARSVIEATAKAKGITSGKIHEKIDRLATDGLIRPGLSRAAHQIRWAGNDAMHGDLTESISYEDALDILKIMDSVLREVFQDPAEEERLIANRAQRRSGQDV